MNERIQELVGQATEPPVFPANIGYFNKEKFAELIVRECADICYNRDYADGSTYGDAIHKHFGVEE